MELPSGYRGRRSAVENLTEDDSLLRAAVASVRVAVVRDGYVSIGVSQPDATPAASRARARGIPVVRRPSGGTGVLQIPGDIAWAVVLPRSHPLVGRTYSRAYARLGAPVVEQLARWGVEAEWRPSPGLSEELCLLGSRGESLFAGDAVLGGAAQHLTGRAILHHGLLNVELDRALIGELFQVPPGTLRAVTGLREHGLTAPSETLARELAERLSALIGPG